MKRTLAVAAFLFASTACVVLAALPAAYGGALRLAATGPIALPHPAHRESPFESALSAAVYDKLSEILHAETEGTQVTLRFRTGVVRQDRRPVRIADLQRSLRRLDRTGARHWLAPIARRNGALQMEVQDDALVVELQQEGVDVHRWLRAAPLAFVVSPGTGTGPFRPRVVRDELRLFQSRSAIRGAPYLQRIHVTPYEGREGELRALMLGQLDGSWSGASLYDTSPPHPMNRHALESRAAVLLVGTRSRSRELAVLGAALDRRRLARVGLTPSERFSELPAPNPSGRDVPRGGRSLAYRAGDVFAAALAEAMAARFDEEGWSIRPRAIPPAQWRSAASRYDYRIAQVVPGLAGGPFLLADAFAETGDNDSAEALVRSGLNAGDAVDAQARARELPALVLGWRSSSLHLDADVHGFELDERGELRLERLHWRRARIEAPR
ncbi:MAG: hypothetical protein AB8H86_23970 [Polyangiales bacterium]